MFNLEHGQRTSRRCNVIEHICELLIDHNQAKGIKRTYTMLDFYKWVLMNPKNDKVCSEALRMVAGGGNISIVENPVYDLLKVYAAEIIDDCEPVIKAKNEAILRGDMEWPM
jgi:hypothetical protein